MECYTIRYDTMRDAGPGCSELTEAAMSPSLGRVGPRVRARRARSNLIIAGRSMDAEGPQMICMLPARLRDVDAAAAPPCPYIIFPGPRQ